VHGSLAGRWPPTLALTVEDGHVYVVHAADSRVHDTSYFARCEARLALIGIEGKPPAI
jgi:hypothetical protein